MESITSHAPALGLLHEPKLNISEAAKALAMSRTTFNKWREAGQLPEPITIANRAYWLERDLERWIIDQNPHLAQRQQLAASAAKAKKQLAAFREKQGASLQVVGG